MTSGYETKLLKFRNKIAGRTLIDSHNIGGGKCSCCGSTKPKTRFAMFFVDGVEAIGNDCFYALLNKFGEGWVGKVTIVKRSAKPADPVEMDCREVKSQQSHDECVAGERAGVLGRRARIMQDGGTLQVRKIGNILEIDGKYYQFTNKYGKQGEMIFEPIDKAKFDDLVNRLTKRLAPVMKNEMILKDALGELPLKNLERIANALERKKKPAKPRQRHGCVELAVGGETIPIR